VVGGGGDRRRYLAYGLVSALLFLAGRRGMRGLARRHWRPALAFAIAGNAGYYLLLVLGIDLAGAPVTDIIIGAIPVTMALATSQLGGSGPRSVGWLAGGSIVLGVGVSWGATALWNLASARLPAVSAGMLVNVETVAGYACVYAAQAHWPPPVQVLGFALLILGVLIVVRLPATPTKHHPPGASQRATPENRPRELMMGGVNRAGPSATAASSVFPSACSS
jgi:drug/metabolite transporter (DMT)-like permease